MPVVQGIERRAFEATTQSRIMMAIGIVLIAIAFVIAGFLVYRDTTGLAWRIAGFISGCVRRYAPGVNSWRRRSVADAKPLDDAKIESPAVSSVYATPGHRTNDSAVISSPIQRDSSTPRDSISSITAGSTTGETDWGTAPSNWSTATSLDHQPETTRESDQDISHGIRPYPLGFSARDPILPGPGVIVWRATSDSWIDYGTSNLPPIVIHTIPSRLARDRLYHPGFLKVPGQQEGWGDADIRCSRSRYV